MHTSLARFFALSIVIHLGTFFMLQPRPMRRITATESIAVSLLPPVEKPDAATEPARASPAPRAAPVPRVAPTPRRTAKAAPLIEKQDAGAGQRNALPAPQQPARMETKILAPPTPPQPIPEETAVVERPLPTMKELLPPATWRAASTRDTGPISLNTKDPLYVSYFTKVKQTIEQQWEYPEVALRYGLQGRLSLEFTIGGNGQLESLRMIRSSGSQVLDEEALRAIKAAAPFPPIPTWIKPIPLAISASMEYHDNRLNYHFSR